MSLYQKLFGRVFMAPAGAEEFTSSGDDRGDNHVPDDASAAEAAAAKAAETIEDDVKLATGETDEEVVEEDPPRAADGKFAKKEKTEGAMIPKSRFDEQVGKERAGREAAERRAAELERAQGQIVRNADLVKVAAQVAALRKQERQAVVDGDEEKAAQLSTEADRLNVLIATEQSKDMTNAAKEQVLENVRLEMTVERIEEKYPVLDEDSEDFDQDITDDVLDKQRGYMERERLSASKALAKAADYVMSRLARTTTAPETAKTGLSAAAKGLDRKTAAVGKNIDAAKRQPASTKVLGVDSDKHGQTSETPEASDMTYEEFGALPESTKAKMRGDFV